MTKTRKIILGVLIAIVVGIGLTSPFAWRAGTLYWAKSIAWRSLNKLDPTERRCLNETPKMIALPPVHLTAPLDESKLGSYTLRVPASTRKTIDPRFITFQYPQFEARILRPYSPTEIDDLVRAFHLKDRFDFYATVFHTRLDDIDKQRGIPSLKRHVLLLQAKTTLLTMGSEIYFAQFDRKNLRGFISGSFPACKVIIIELYIPATDENCTMTFTNHDGATMTDVLEFLAALEIEPRTNPSTTLGSP